MKRIPPELIVWQNIAYRVLPFSGEVVFINSERVANELWMQFT